jgi:hypothetical protein
MDDQPSHQPPVESRLDGERTREDHIRFSALLRTPGAARGNTVAWDKPAGIAPRAARTNLSAFDKRYAAARFGGIVQRTDSDNFSADDDYIRIVGEHP